MPTFSGPVVAWRAAAEAEGHTAIEGLVAGARPGGRVVRTVYEEFREEILSNLARAGAVDAVLLSLHGAMVADGVDDCEGDLLERMRSSLGKDVVIGCLLDPHCVLTKKMVGNCDLIVIYKEWPHTDYMVRASELYSLVTRAAQGVIHPTMVMADCRMLGNYPTMAQPMRGFVDSMLELERKGAALSVSFAHSFIWADVSEMGSKVLVITYG